METRKPHRIFRDAIRKTGNSLGSVCIQSNVRGTNWLRSCAGLTTALLAPCTTSPSDLASAFA